MPPTSAVHWRYAEFPGVRVRLARVRGACLNRGLASHHLLVPAWSSFSDRPNWHTDETTSAIIVPGDVSIGWQRSRSPHQAAQLQTKLK
jgi:hypothetical protein